MGAVANVVKKFVGFVGNCIQKVVSWWSSHKERVNNITYQYIVINQEFINESQNPQAVMELMSIKKEKDQLDEIADAKYMSLSSSDRYRIDQLLDQRDY
jgi:hypothetical protein